MAKVTGGSFAALCAVAGSLLRPVGGVLSDRFGGTRVLGVVLTVSAGAAAALATVPPLAPTVALLVGLLGLLGMGNGAVFQLVGRRLPERVGAMTGLVGAAGGVGGFVLALGLGALASATGTFATGFALFANVAGLMALAVAGRDRAWAVPRRLTAEFGASALRIPQ
jgi:NNP family nitrate/nitrite transporter-like MFS transporter